MTIFVSNPLIIVFIKKIVIIVGIPKTFLVGTSFLVSIIITLLCLLIVEIIKRIKLNGIIN